ncbi:hypothetical protein GCM10027190_37110 [Spirosoma areae]
MLSCRVNSSSTTLEPSFYRVVHAPQPELVNKKLYVIDSGDSLQVILPTTYERRNLPRSAYQNWVLYSREIDVDVFTLPFKIRPARTGLPSQLNSNFNAALYVGRRIDSYRYRWQPVTPTYDVRTLRSRGFGYGLFVGIGSATINDFVVRQPISIEYEGVILDAGVAAIYDARIFNVGLAVGIDYLTDRHRQNWIYQQRPWFGVLFGLNLN